jgi:hypothetical protein
MEIKLLDSTHIPLLQEFYVASMNESLIMNEKNFEVFCDTYTTGLNSYAAYICLDGGKITALVSFYKSIDVPAWFVTNIYSTNADHVRELFDTIISTNESTGRLKFYVLMDANYADSFDILSDNNSSRYGFFDEFVVEEKNRCLYTLPWLLLYARILHSKRSIERCYFLKQEYRVLPNGGNL